MASWLTDNGEMLAATFGPRCTFYPVVAGSIVEGLLTPGSDVDLCAMVDGVGLVRDTSGAQDSYKRSISALDKGLKEMGLGGVCRISRRIRHADDFLELHRCHESKAAVMRAGVRMNFILTCRLLNVEVNERELGMRVATGPMLTCLKRRLYGCYCKTLGLAHIPVLSHLLKRPGGYTPKRVAMQVQVAANDLLLAADGIERISGELADKLSRVVDIYERKRTLMECDRMKEDFGAAIDLIRELKTLSLTDRNAHRRSFNYLILKGYMKRAQWELVRQLTDYLYERIGYSAG